MILVHTLVWRYWHTPHNVHFVIWMRNKIFFWEFFDGFFNDHDFYYALQMICHCQWEIVNLQPEDKDESNVRLSRSQNWGNAPNFISLFTLGIYCDLSLTMEDVDVHVVFGICGESKIIRRIVQVRWFRDLPIGCQWGTENNFEEHDVWLWRSRNEKSTPNFRSRTGYLSLTTGHGGHQRGDIMFRYVFFSFRDLKRDDLTRRVLDIRWYGMTRVEGGKRSLGLWPPSDESPLSDQRHRWTRITRFKDSKTQRLGRCDWYHDVKISNPSHISIYISINVPCISTSIEDRPADYCYLYE